MKRIILLLILLLTLNTCNGAINGTTVLLIDDTKDNTSKQLILYTDEYFTDFYEYPAKIYTDDDKAFNYTIIIQEEYIDIVNDYNFVNNLLTKYGNLIISLVLICFILGVLVYYFKRGS